MSDDNKIKNMIKTFRDMKELQLFCEQQHIAIMELTKKVQSLTEKNKHMENLLQQQVPVLVGGYKPPAIVGPNDEADEELICRMELKKLKDLSMERQLSYEETKKVEVYTKLLLALNQKIKNNNEASVKNKPTSELLRLVTEETND